MPKISKQKKDKISEQILSYLFSIFPNQKFTSDIAKELARDEEFIKNLLEDLAKKDLIVKINMNPQGFKYTRRVRWRISNKSYQAYKNLQ
jgi:predicted transcriptional regulator with HTH domain